MAFMDQKHPPEKVAVSVRGVDDDGGACEVGFDDADAEVASRSASPSPARSIAVMRVSRGMGSSVCGRIDSGVRP